MENSRIVNGKRSAAERIVWVATRRKTVGRFTSAHGRLEAASMERGLFLLEVVVSAAPLWITWNSHWTRSSFSQFQPEAGQGIPPPSPRV